MEAIAIYLLKMSGILGILLLFYGLLLRKETFFKTNRWYLLAGLFLGLILPLLNYTKIETVVLPYIKTPNYNAVNSQIAEETSFISWFLLVCIVYGIGTFFFFSRLLLQLLQIRRLKEQCKLTKQGNYKLYKSTPPIAPFSFF